QTTGLKLIRRRSGRARAGTFVGSRQPWLLAPFTLARQISTAKHLRLRRVPKKHRASQQFEQCEWPRPERAKRLRSAIVALAKCHDQARRNSSRLASSKRRLPARSENAAPAGRPQRASVQLFRAKQTQPSGATAP